MSFALIVSVISRSDSFKKSYMYSDNAMILSSRLTKSNLECAVQCAKDIDCSMIIITLRHAKDIKHYGCKNYKLANNYNYVDISNQSDFKVWYKMQITKEIMSPEPSVTTPSDYFVLLGSGYFYADVGSTMSWEDAKHYCQNLATNSNLADFQSVLVSN